MKPTLLLLHGALGTATQLFPLGQLMSDLADVHWLTFAGHGGQALHPAEFTMPHFAGQAAGFIAQLAPGPVHLFGYSMGGYAALLAALAQPGRVASVTILGTKFDWSPEAAAAETRLLDPDKMAAKIPAFAEELRQRHAPTPWAEVVRATATLMQQLGQQPLLAADQLQALTMPVQILVGEQDLSAGPAASAALAEALPQGRFAQLPATPHPLERVDLSLLRPHLELVLSR